MSSAHHFAAFPNCQATFDSRYGEPYVINLALWICTLYLSTIGPQKLTTIFLCGHKIRSAFPLQSSRLATSHETSRLNSILCLSKPILVVKTYISTLRWMFWFQGAFIQGAFQTLRRDTWQTSSFLRASTLCS